MLGKLCFSGPRVKCAATSQPAHVVPELLEGKGARVSDTSVALLDVMHGGQVRNQASCIELGHNTVGCKHGERPVAA